jgi:hypothetical protein
MVEDGAAALSESNNDSETNEQPKGKSPQEWEKYWGREYDASNKRLRTFTRQGNRIVARFLGDTTGARTDNMQSREDTPFKLNLFNSNVRTLQNMMFGNTPKTDISRDNADPGDDVARVAAVIYQRMLAKGMETSGDDVSTTLKANLQDRLLPGLGVSKVRYAMESQVVTDINGLQQEVLLGEDAPIDYYNWQDFRWGWARTWNEIPWTGFRSWLTKEEAKGRFGADLADELTYVNQLPSGQEKTEDPYDPDQQNNTQKAEIWEFWNKDDRRVYWWSPGLDVILDQKDDPLGLENFWPCPMPMAANLTTTLWLPKADYVLAQDLYNEIDVLQTRISIITRAIKVVGVYDKAASSEVGRMLKEGNENDLIPVDNWAMFAEKGGLKGVVDWFPVETIVNVLNVLTGVRDQTIELLYQITGMSDVIRGGNTDQYTAAKTQQLKAQFGSVTIQALQEDFARFASDLVTLKAEVISKHFSIESISTQASVEFLPEPDHQYIGQALQLMKSPGVSWRVSIKPESIAMIDYAALKAERTEYLMAMSQFIQSASGLMTEVPESMPALLEMLKWGMAGFKGADYLEGIMDQAIEAAKQPKQDDGDPEAQREQMAQQFEMQKLQMELQKQQMKTQGDLQLEQQKNHNAMQQEMQDHQNKLEQENAQLQADLQRTTADLRADLETIAAKLAATLAEEEAQSTFAAGEAQLEHENTMTEIEANADMETSQERETDTD